MKGQGSAALWIVAIGLIALFTLATIVAPALMHQVGVGSNREGGDNATTALTFKMPSMTMDAAPVVEGSVLNMTVRASPETSTTGDGGSFAWIFSLEGNDLQSDSIIIAYSDQQVQWYPGQSGALVGIGPRFEQGPGAAAIDATSTLTFYTNKVGSYTVRTWVAVVGKLMTLDPSGLKASSPAQTATLVVNENLTPVEPSISVAQNLVLPSGNIGEDQWSTVTLTDSGEAQGKWAGSITDLIAIEKQGIRTSDVLLRVSTDRGMKYVTWTDTGDSLVGSLAAVSPFPGSSDAESKTWTTNMEIEFMNSGTYTVLNWAVETGTTHNLSPTYSQTVVVKKIYVAPTVPVDTYSLTNSTPSTTIPTASSQPSLDVPVVPTDQTNRTTGNSKTK